jgi:hypothetical protein
MAETSLPWGVEDQEDAPAMYQAAWRKLLTGLMSDGVINDTDGDGLKVTATGSSTQLQVQPGEHLIQGVRYVLDEAKTLDLASFGTPPSSGQTRVDLVIVQYDPTAQTVIATIKAGAPATSGAAEAALTRSSTGVWEHRLARIDRTGNVAVNQSMISDRRTWSTPSVYTPFMEPLSNAPIGSLAVQVDNGGDILRRGTASGSPTWISVLNPEWNSLTTGAETALAAPTAKWRLRGGLVEVVGRVVKTAGSWNAGNNVHVGTVPSQVRPTADSWGVVACTGGPAVTTRAAIRASTGRIEVQIPPDGDGTSGISLNGLCWDV